MTIYERVELYKSLFKECKALDPVKAFIQPIDPLEALEAIRELNTTLADLYMVSLPVITVWVRDSSYVQATGDIFNGARAGAFSTPIPPPFAEYRAKV